MTEKSIRRHKSGRLYWEISWNEPQSHNDLREERDGHVRMKSLSLFFILQLCAPTSAVDDLEIITYTLWRR